MEHLIDISFDKALSNIDGLNWLPWIGNNYKNNKRRLLIVGESHYVPDAEENLRKIVIKSAETPLHTRNTIYESPVCGEWENKIFNNIHKVLLRTNDFDKELFWKQVCYYNFIPKLMDYRIKERPAWIDFYTSWKSFVDLIKILNPTDCLFIGVSASNSFNPVMEKLEINHSPIKRLEKIGTAYARTTSLKIRENDIKIFFIQHASKMFSWDKWNIFLESKNKDILTTLKNIVFSKGTSLNIF